MRRRLLAGCALAAVLAPSAALAQLALNAGGTLTGGGGGPNIVQNGGTTDITLGAARTILAWNAFNLGANETVIYRLPGDDAIVLNRVAGQAVIDGTIEGLVGSQRGGNVWFSAPGGVIFGNNAKVNVGGLLATPAAIANGAFLDPGNLSFAFTGGGGQSVQVRSGAQVNGFGGTVALVAGSVSSQSGGSIAGGSGSTVLLGAANDFTVRFAPQPGGLDLLDFVVPAGGGTASATPLALGGQTVGDAVFLAVVNRADVASAVINAPGVVAAQSARTDRGDVVLSAGADIVNRLPTTAKNTTTQTTANFGVISAQRDLAGGFASPTTLVAGQLAAGRDLGLLAASFDVGTLNAGRLLALNAPQNITIRTSASAGSQASFSTPGALVVGGGNGSINSIGRLTIQAGTVSAGSVNSGRSVVVNASGAGANGGPAVSIGAGLAEDDILITTTNASGHIVLGSAFITGARNDEAPAGRTVSLIAQGATADVTFGPSAGGTILGATNVAFEAGRNVTVNYNGLLTLNRGVAGSTFLIRAGDVDLLGPITAATLRMESLVGALTLGGAAAGVSGSGLPAAGAAGLEISDAEFQRITVTQGAIFVAGATGSSADGDLTVRNLTVDPTRMPRLMLGAGADNDVSITGVVAPTVNGSAVAIGGVEGFEPERILVMGSLGVSTGTPEGGFTSVRAFNEVSLSAQQDILLGSQRFIGLIAGLTPDQIDVRRDQPAGAAAIADELNRLLITAGVLSLDASNRIVQQNTGAGELSNGLFLTNNAAAAQVVNLTPAAVVDLFGSYVDRNGTVRAGLNGAVVNIVRTPGADLSDVRLNGANAAATSGMMQAQTTRNVVVSDLVPTVLPGSSGNPFGPTSFSNPPPPPPQAAASSGTSGPGNGPDSGGPNDSGGSSESSSSASSESSEAGEAESSEAASESANVPASPPLISIAQPDLSEQVTDPVTTGTGADELWRNRPRPTDPR